MNDDIELSGEMNGSQHTKNNSSGSKNNGSSQSSSGTGSASSDCSGQYPLEICFHVKEAWNIFEVRVSCMYVCMYVCMYGCMYGCREG